MITQVIRTLQNLDILTEVLEEIENKSVFDSAEEICSLPALSWCRPFCSVRDGVEVKVVDPVERPPTYHPLYVVLRKALTGQRETLVKYEHMLQEIIGSLQST